MTWRAKAIVAQGVLWAAILIASMFFGIPAFFVIPMLAVDFALTMECLLRFGL